MRAPHVTTPRPPRRRIARALLAALLAITGAAANAALATTDGVLASPAGVHALLIEDFNGYTSGSFPTAWKVRGDRGQAENVYRVSTENGSGRFLAARADHSSVMIGLDRPFEPDRYPFLRWRWRVRQLPAGGDERESATNDSAAGVYVIFPGRMPFAPKVLKYVWSARAPVGLRQPSPRYGNTKIIVIESGLAGGSDAWRTALVNVRDDYTALFGAPPPAARGIGLLTDANDTGSVAAADYASFELLSRLPDAVAAPAAGAGIRAGTVSH
jgi:hypothetical protein